MTNEEAISQLEWIKNIILIYTKDENGERVVDKEPYEAFRVAIKALQQNPCEDAISRQAVIEITVETGALETQHRVMNLPSVQPKAKTGKWLHRNDDYNDWSECSECGYGDEGEVKFGEETPYCPYCGAKMEGETE